MTIGRASSIKKSSTRPGSSANAVCPPSSVAVQLDGPSGHLHSGVAPPSGRKTKSQLGELYEAKCLIGTVFGHAKLQLSELYEAKHFMGTVFWHAEVATFRAL